MMQTLFQNPVIIQGTVFMVSDFHLGAPDYRTSEEREERIVAWLSTISEEATHLFLLGDIFDFWFEYQDVVPKGYYKFWSQISLLVNKGIQIYFFTGNHDMWVKNYFKDKFGFKIYKKQQAFIINGKKCMIGHGDGLGSDVIGYKIIKKLFSFKFNIFLYSLLHPRIAFGIAHFCSRKSRIYSTSYHDQEINFDTEKLYQYILDVSSKEEIDYFIYGHRHLPLEIKMPTGSVYYNTGDWMTHDSWLRMDDHHILLFQKTDL
ncbi:MAG: UDP-2,3-diacylglucosamine diphosphatase [Bacteroidales bacterium]|jgi:UDP-2,3-diacylglucosamine hydrolase|nr:UDP-2,3-diacylglucosamine diphosphatase [Bacteroidales bacterium]